MNILALVGAGLIGAVLSIVIKQYKPEFSMYISLLTGMIILLVILSAVKPAIETLKNLIETANINETYGEILIKSLAICYISQLATDSCKDAGETAIGGKIELAGKIAILITALPLFTGLATMITSLI